MATPLPNGVQLSTTLFLTDAEFTAIEYAARHWGCPIHTMVRGLLKRELEQLGDDVARKNHGNAGCMTPVTKMANAVSEKKSVKVRKQDFKFRVHFEWTEDNLVRAVWMNPYAESFYEHVHGPWMRTEEAALSTLLGLVSKDVCDAFMYVDFFGTPPVYEGLG